MVRSLIVPLFCLMTALVSASPDALALPGETSPLSRPAVDALARFPHAPRAEAHPAVDRDVGAGDVLRRVAAEPDDLRGDLVTGLPLRLKQACAEYANRAVTAALAPDPEVDPKGKVTLVRERVEGAVEEETRYAESINAVTLRSYPKADRLLRHYRASLGGALARA